MCQNVSCYPLTHLYPSYLQAFPNFLGKATPADPPTLSYTCSRFLDKTDKKVVCKQVQVEEE